MPEVFKRKILSFSTTIRNPSRMANFLFAMLNYENEILTHNTIMEIVKNVLRLKLYEPNYIKENTSLKEIFYTPEETFTDEQLDTILSNSTQNHKERGFDNGWESRFDTWYKLMSEFGFCYYTKEQPILISAAGKMLIESCYNIEDMSAKEHIDETLMSSVFLNALSKYEVGNPYKKNLNHNNPFKLLLRLLRRLRESELSPLSIKEIPILLCWQNKDDNALFEYILELRKEHSEINQIQFSYSNEFIFEKCLKLLESTNTKRFKISQVTREAVDEYIRKMRITGLISLRGGGRFIDINQNELEKVDYILSNIPSFSGNYLDDSDQSRFEFYQFMSKLDYQLITQTSQEVSSDVKIEKLRHFSQYFQLEQVENELKITCSSGKNSSDEFLKFIDKPLRFEFLTAIFLCQNFDSLSVFPNYKCDDEGNPVFTASGGMADIVAYDNNTESYIEVSLIRNRTQTSNEMIPISRHLKEYISNSDNSKNKFSIFVAPIIHPDAKDYAEFMKYRDNLDIVCYGINDFIEKTKESKKILELNG